MLTSGEIKARARQQPFVPFRIVTSSGETCDVFHPDLTMVGSRDIHVGTPNIKDPTTYDSVARLAIMHVTALQDLPKAVPPAGNGEK
jgi:hypothetical protein